MPTKVSLLGAVCALALAGTAQAKGWYIGLEAGASSIADTGADFRSTSAGLTTFVYDPVARFDDGWAVIATMGYALHGWRIEGELAWRSNDKDQFTTPALPSTGSLDALTAMYNMTYEFPLADGLGVSVGGGAGLDYAMLDIAGLDDSDLNIAYQGIAGINYAIGANTELTLAYRYLNVMDPEFEERSNPGIVIRFDDFAKHTLTLGLRYTYAP
ncbi:MAG: porin family protein [Alphaproteobacteria bacterium]|nr:porin family protein [Alphaproteobacteria bacterium]